MRHCWTLRAGILCFLLGHGVAQCQMADTSGTVEKYHIEWKRIILPTAMMGYGTLSFVSKNIRDEDFKIQDKFIGKGSVKIDDYLIYAPITIDLVMTAGGIKSKHNIRDKAVLYLMATALNAMIVYPVKSLTNRQRPDQSDTHSFPSGHTSNAFVGAEFFWQEYKNRSKLLASAGYIFAGTTGYFRIRNNKHWFSDVVAGAGIGILSTRLVYAVYPKIAAKIFPNKSRFVVLPFNFDRAYGLSFHYKLE